MKIIQGDLLQLALDGHFDVIVHGCNCFNTFGAGIAYQIKLLFPEAYATDLQTKKGDKSKLGTITTTTINREDKTFIIVNAYTQYSFSNFNSPVAVDYDAVRNIFKIIANLFKEKRIGLPMIGAGLAGGDWKIISKIIEEELKNINYTVVEFKKT